MRRPILGRTGGRRLRLIDTDFRGLQDDLTGRNACRSICAKMSHVSGCGDREFSLSTWEIGNICQREGCLLATPLWGTKTVVSGFPARCLVA